VCVCVCLYVYVWVCACVCVCVCVCMYVSKYDTGVNNICTTQRVYLDQLPHIVWIKHHQQLPDHPCSQKKIDVTECDATQSNVTAR
jgi:hypothetical protein